jgi:hypothetical protein
MKPLRKTAVGGCPKPGAGFRCGLGAKKNKFWRLAYTWSINDNADMAMQKFT